MRTIFFILISALAVIVIVLILTAKTQPNNPAPIADNLDISKKAVEMYQKAKEQGVNLSNGPCLGVIDGYAVDIAHLPREKVDDLPENQCPDYNNGKLKHFIELTPLGTIIRRK